MKRESLAFLFYLLSIFILIDEYISQGYILDPGDILAPRITHEKLWLATLLIAILLSIRRKEQLLQNR